MINPHRFLTATGLVLSVGACMAVAVSSPSPGADGGSGPVQFPQTAQAEYVGSQTCRLCHSGLADEWQATAMGRAFLGAPQNELESRGCEACHGPGSEHVAGGGDTTRILRFSAESRAAVGGGNAACLQCHRQGDQAHWEGSVHQSRDVACTQCHEVMREVSPQALLVTETATEVCLQCHLQRNAQAELSSHMPVREGRLDCLDCHNPHGSDGPSLLQWTSVNETCYACHPERRGPFLWEHAPVTESCLNCHQPHGSLNDNLLTVRAPRLCQSCHIEQQHPTSPQAADARFAFNRSCTNCHSQVHGSNHPSGARLQR